jgi:hypothetical protein
MNQASPINYADSIYQALRITQIPAFNLFLIDLYYHIRYFLNCLAHRGNKNYVKREY